MENKSPFEYFDDIKFARLLVQKYNEQQGKGDVKFTVKRIEINEASDDEQAQKMA